MPGDEGQFGDQKAGKPGEACAWQGCHVLMSNPGVGVSRKGRGDGGREAREGSSSQLMESPQ